MRHVQAQLNALGGAASRPAVAAGDGGSGPGLIGWFHRDEPDGVEPAPPHELPGAAAGRAGSSRS